MAVCTARSTNEAPVNGGAFRHALLSTETGSSFRNDINFR